MPSIQEGYRGVEVGVPLVRHGRTRDIRGCPMTGLWLCLKQASMGVPLHRSIEGLPPHSGVALALFQTSPVRETGVHAVAPIGVVVRSRDPPRKSLSPRGPVFYPELPAPALDRFEAT